MSNCDSCSNKESSNLNNIQDNKIKNIIAVMSGKGGVGKSTMSVMIARQLVQRGYRVGVLDADITGPSIPRLLNIEEERAVGTENLIFPVESSEGIKVMSLNLVVENEDEAVIAPETGKHLPGGTSAFVHRFMPPLPHWWKPS